jgi:hypothetical protein
MAEQHTATRSIPNADATSRTTRSHLDRRMSAIAGLISLGANDAAAAGLAAMAAVYDAEAVGMKKTADALAARIAVEGGLIRTVNLFGYRERHLELLSLAAAARDNSGVVEILLGVADTVREECLAFREANADAYDAECEDLDGLVESSMAVVAEANVFGTD